MELSALKDKTKRLVARLDSHDVFEVARLLGDQIGDIQKGTPEWKLIDDLCYMALILSCDYGLDKGCVQDDWLGCATELKEVCHHYERNEWSVDHVINTIMKHQEKGL